MDRDPYWKLKPPPPTPANEICSCAGEPPIALRAYVSDNPLVCADCNFEVPPERIGFSPELAEKLVCWQTFYCAFYHLWLDSGEFEEWAKAQLCDAVGPVNTRGLVLREDLSHFRQCYYSWFVDRAADDFTPPSRCPRCGAGLVAREHSLLCERCAILL